MFGVTVGAADSLCSFTSLKDQQPPPSHINLDLATCIYTDEAHVHSGDFMHYEKHQNQPRKLVANLAKCFASPSKLGVVLRFMPGLCYFQFLFSICFFSPVVLDTLQQLNHISYSSKGSCTNGFTLFQEPNLILFERIFQMLQHHKALGAQCVCSAHIFDWWVRFIKNKNKPTTQRQTEKEREDERDGEKPFFNFSIVERYRSASRRLATVSATASATAGAHIQVHLS